MQINYIRNVHCRYPLNLDEKNRLIKEIDQTNNETLYTCEGSNPNPTSITNNEQTTTFNYDGKFNLIQMQRPDG